jgi:hypothetical protein
MTRAMTGAHWTMFPGVAFVIVICFVVAHLSIAFAGEVDDGTAGFLRMLPCRTSTLGLAKLSAVFAGSVLLAVAIIATSTLIEVTAQALPWLSKPSGHRTVASLEDSLPPVLGIWILCCAAVFGSLISRKVISAVGVAAVLVLSSVLITVQISDGSSRATFTALVWTTSISVALLAVSVLMLMPQWHLGRLPWSGTLPLAVCDSAGRRLPSFTRLWHAWLARVASKPMSQRRVFSTLLWRECRSAIPFAITWMSIGIVLVCGQLFFTAMPWTALFMLVFIHECGQRTMREDQRSGSITLLANVGVSARLVWWSKIGCWLSVAILGTVCLIAADYSLPWRYLDQPSLLRMIDRIHVLTNPSFSVITGNLISPESIATTQDRWLQVGTCVSIILGLFSIGHLTATWIQRQVLAIAASFVLTMCAAILLLPMVISQDWPIWIAVVPTPFCLLAATVTTARRWIDRTITWSFRVQQMAWLAIAILGIPALGWFAWSMQPRMALAKLVNQNPSIAAAPSGDFTHANPEILSQLKILAQIESMPVAAWSKHDEATQANCWHDFFTVLKSAPAHGLLKLNVVTTGNGWLGSTPLSACLPPNVKRELIQDLLKPFETTLEQDNAFPLLPIAWTAPWSETPAPHITAVLLEDARYREADGDITGAVQQMVRAIKLCRSLSLQTASWQAWWQSLDSERVALGRLRLLLGTADLTSLDLESLFEELKAEFIVRKQNNVWKSQWHDIRLMPHRRTVFYRTAIANPVEFFDAIQKRPVVEQCFTTARDLLGQACSELEGLSTLQRDRVIATMMLSETLVIDRYQSQAIQGKFEFQRPLRQEQVLQLARFLATSHIADLMVDHHALNEELFDVFNSGHIDTIASERATLLSIKLQQYRLAHSAFPESLLKLLDENRWNSQMLIDPYTGAPFFYTPNVVEKSVRTDFTPVLRKPEVVVTGGRILACLDGSFSSFYRVFHLTWDEESAIHLQFPPNLILFVGLHDPLDWRLQQIATPVTPTIPSPDVIPQDAADPPTEQTQD